MGADTDSLLEQFVEAACAPYHGHSEGSLGQAEALLAAHPDLRERGIQVAAILGDAAAIRRGLERDPASATAKGLRGWDPLTSLCFSRYLKLDADARGFVEAATALLEAGASPTTGFQQEDEYESVLYGAAGVAHHPELTRLLLERGADPNDEEG